MRQRAAATLAWLAAFAAAMPPHSAVAQVPDTLQHHDSVTRDTTAHDTATVRPLTDDLAAEIVFLYNGAPHRSAGDASVPSDTTIEGTFATRDGTVDVAGTVHGGVVVINGSLRLRATARVAGDVFVVGGRLTRTPGDSVGGRVSVVPQQLRYRTVRDLLIAEQQEADSADKSWFRRWQRGIEQSRNWFTVKGGVYNRVEGFPIILGPSIRRPTSFGQVRFAALGIYRSADDFAWKDENLGWDIAGDLRFGDHPAISVGGGYYRRINSVEDWQLKDSEVSLMSFLFGRDYRDYYEQEGGTGWVRWDAPRDLSVTLAYTSEVWRPRDARDPFNLFRNGSAWRPNPTLDAGRFESVVGTIGVDTRNDERNPWTGWLISLAIEYGWSDGATLGPASPLARDSVAGPVALSYTSAFLDARRYNRLSPEDQLNLRFILGGWLGGDRLPLERRLSLGGGGSMPGYDFRGGVGGTDVFTCSDGTAVSGDPAQCERLILLQAEYRRDFRLRLFHHHVDGRSKYAVDRLASWVFFTDAGRGWLVGDRAGDLRYPSGSFPSLDTFKADFGAGLDVHWFGVFITKSITDWGNQPNFLIRLGSRF